MTEYRIIRSNRRTLALEITRNGEVLVRAPIRMDTKIIEGFVVAHKEWIAKSLAKQQKRLENKYEPTDSEIAELKAKAKEFLPKRVEYFSRLTGLKCSGIKITSAKTRFGSCSGKNSICFSYMLMHYPAEAIDYVVLHELAHTVQHNHSRKFWALVEKYMPDYKERQKLLKG